MDYIVNHKKFFKSFYIIFLVEMYRKTQFNFGFYVEFAMLIEYFIIVILFPNYISVLKLKIFNNTDYKRVVYRKDKEKNRR